MYESMALGAEQGQVARLRAQLTHHETHDVMNVEGPAIAFCPMVNSAPFALRVRALPHGLARLPPLCRQIERLSLWRDSSAPIRMHGARLMKPMGSVLQVWRTTISQAQLTKPVPCFRRVMPASEQARLALAETVRHRVAAARARRDAVALQVRPHRLRIAA